MSKTGKDHQHKPFVCHIPQGYLDAVNITDPAAAAPEQLDRLIRIAYIDFFVFRLNLDDFSTICEDIWRVLTLQKREREFHNLADVAYSGAELSWYIRNIKETKDAAVAAFLSALYKYVMQRDKH